MVLIGLLFNVDVYETLKNDKFCGLVFCKIRLFIGLNIVKYKRQIPPASIKSVLIVL